MKVVWLMGFMALGGTAVAGNLPVNVTVLEEGLVVEQFPEAASAQLEVFLDDKLVSKTQFSPAEGVVLPFMDSAEQAYPDGNYTFTVTYAPYVVGQLPADGKDIANGRDLVPVTEGMGGVVSGYFRLKGGSVPVAEVELNNQFERIEK